MSGPLAARGGARLRRAILLLSLVAGVGLAAPVWAARAIARVEVRAEPGRVLIVLAADSEEPLQYTAFSLADPPRLVFDLADARLAPDVATAYPLDSPSVKQVRLGQFSLQPDITRVVVDLCGPGSAPPWGVVPGTQSETLIAIGKAGPIALPSPAVEKVEGAVLVRLPGVGGLARKVGTLEAPPRVYLDLVGAVAAQGLEQDCEEAPLRQIRFGQQTPEEGRPVARVVVELRKEQAHSVYSDGNDLVIAVGPQPWALPLPEYRGAGRLKGKTVVVDAGHGGNDIGAPALFGRPPEGPYEKDIVLDIAQRLARLLVAEGASVKMTREDDTYIALQERAAIANRLQADALVSLHCNSCDAPDTLRGTSVYYDHPHSQDLARLVQEEMIASLGTVDKGVRNANFAVIRRTQGPGILVETAFINHRGDRARLTNPNFRERAARAILRGLTQFLSNKPDGRNGEE